MVLQIKHVVLVGGGESGEKGYHRRIYPKTFTTISDNSLLFSVVFPPPPSPPITIEMRRRRRRENNRDEEEGIQE